MTYTPNVSYPEHRFLAFWQKLNIQYHLEPQYPVPSPYPGYCYYLDFAHLDSMTAIEIDGQWHTATQEQIEKDRHRQDYLEGLGWEVIRLPAKEVNKAPVQACYRVKREIEARLG